MSLRDLARQHLETIAKPSLSGVRTYRGVRPGQNGSSPYSSKDEACPDAGRNPDSLSGPDKSDNAGQTGQVGHFGQLGQPGQVGQGGAEPAPIPSPVSLEDRRASVEAIYAQMEVERERRRDWYAQPVEGWRDGRLTLRNIVRDESVVVDLGKWRSGR